MLREKLTHIPPSPPLPLMTQHRRRKKPYISKPKLLVITKLLLKSSLNCGSRARHAALDVLASTVSISMKGRECLMECGGSGLVVEILSVAIEGSSGEEKLLREEVRLLPRSFSRMRDTIESHEFSPCLPPLTRKHTETLKNSSSSLRYQHTRQGEGHECSWILR